MQKIFLFLILILGLSSCDGDFFSTTIEIDPPEPELRIATSANMMSIDSVLRIFVDRSTSIFEDVRFNDNGLENAKVELYADNNLVGEFVNQSDPNNPNLFTDPNYSLDLGNSLASFGNKFELVISHPSYPTTRATQVLPNASVPTDFEFVANAGSDSYGYQTEGIRFTIHDEPGVKNYYEVSPFSLDSLFNGVFTEYYSNGLYPISFDANSVPGPNNSIFITDQYIDGQSHEILIQFEGYSQESSTIVLLFSAITEDRYLYGTSIRNFNNAQDFGPFAEPVAIYSNFEDGFGTFGLANTQIFTIKK